MDIKQRQCQGPVGKEQDMKKTALYVAAAALCAAALAGCTAGGAAQGIVAAPQAQAEATRSISVEAYETISLTPDMAAIGVGVVNEAATVEEVTSQNSEAVEKIIGCFRELGYEDASMDTSDIGLYPQYDYSGGESVLTGYRMDTTISLTDVPTEQVSDVLSAALEQGANTINSIRYFSSEYDEAYEEALGKAIAAAKEKAEAMAEAAGTELSGTLSITEHASNDYARYSSTNGYLDYGTSSTAMRAEGAAMDVAVMPGTVEARADVTVVYGMK